MHRLHVVLLTIVAALSAAAPASAGVAPGRVTFPFGTTAIVRSVDPFGPSLGVALPDGRVVLAGILRGKGVTLVRLRPDGALDPSFGAGGIARLAVPFDKQLVGAFPEQLLRRPDGRLLLVYDGRTASKYQGPHLVVAGFTADGRLDRSYGDRGIADAGVQRGCGGGCTPAALTSDGSVVLTGAIGQVSPAIEHDPNAPQDFTWVVARLTPAGTLDRGFGEDGLAKILRGSTHGFSVGVFGDGSIAATGNDGNTSPLARLTPSGAADAAFHGGAPVALADSLSPPLLLARGDGTTDRLVLGQSTAELRRASRAGEPGPSTAVDGGAGSPALVAAPDGTELVVVPETLEPVRGELALRITRVGADGTVVRRARVPMPFAGGLASVFARQRPVQVMPLGQTVYRPGRAIVRPDGRLLVPGGVGVVQYTGEGEGFMHEEEAAALLGADLQLDPSFGGPARRARISLRVPAQRAALVARPNTLRVAVDATTSGTGLARLEVRAGKRLIARSTAPVYRTGRQRLPALLTV